MLCGVPRNRIGVLAFALLPLLQHAAVRNVSLYERIVVDESFCAAHAAAAGSAGTACFNFIAAVHQYARALHTVQPMLTALDVEVTRVQHFLGGGESPNLGTTASARVLEQDEFCTWPTSNANSTAAPARMHDDSLLPPESLASLPQLPSQSLWEP